MTWVPPTTIVDQVTGWQNFSNWRDDLGIFENGEYYFCVERETGRLLGGHQMLAYAIHLRVPYVIVEFRDE